MTKKFVVTAILFIIIPLCVTCFNGEPSGQDLNNKIKCVENEIPQFSDPDPFALLLKLFNNMLNSEFTSKQPKASLDSLMAEYKIPGVSIAVIDNYKIDWTKAYGKIHAGREIEVEPDTYFEAGSTTKIVTAALVMKLVELGTLDLDRDVNDYLKSWKIPDSPLLNNKKVTLRVLLSHQAGLSEGNNFGRKEGEIPTVVDVLEGREPATNEALKIESEPETKWRYSNFGFIVIQLLLKDHTGRTYAELMQEHVFNPLKMTRSTFAHYDKKAIRDEAAVPHDAEGTPHERDMNATIKAHGDLQSTPKDLAIFTIEIMKAYVGKPSKLFSRETAREMLKVSRKIKPEEFFGIQDKSYGFGAILMGENDAFCFMHPGSNNPGNECWLMANPTAGKGAVIMTNGARGMLLNLQMIASISLVYDWPKHIDAE
ncbi:MAG: serine hydrolase domain-containing protein [Planctomycetota bacterium]|jgi:CubicO group peptidase (beta-lactamase class C family)